MRAIKEVLKASYTGFYVDEYQDCSLVQHALVLAMAEIFPCRILGDPLQGIFNFPNSPTITWGNQVTPHFESLPELVVPHRWQQHGCSQLGTWLATVRQNILNGQQIDLSQSPQSVNYIPAGSDIRQTQSTACYNLRSGSGTVVAIHAHRNQYYNLAQSLRGGYSALEPIDSDDLFEHAEKIERETGYGRALAIVEFACECMTVATDLAPVKTALANQRAYRGAKVPEQNTALTEVVASVEISLVERALGTIRIIPGANFKRDELFHAMVSALKEYQTGKYSSLKDAAWNIRNNLRYTGRSTRDKVLGTTLLVKGLEYDHALILNADELKPQELYVAMTRGTKSLTIISRNQQITGRAA